MDNIKRYTIHKKGAVESKVGRMCKYSDHKAIVEELTDKLIKSNKDYCPERIGYEVGYKYIHENCNGLDCDKCTRDQIEKGLINE